MKINPTTLEKKLKLKFSDQKIFIKSLTHKSFDSINNNEKIEFLGDRVLGLIIAKKLLELYPEEREGGQFCQTLAPAWLQGYQSLFRWLFPG